MEPENRTPQEKERNLKNELYDQAMCELGLTNIVIGLSLSLAVAIGSGLTTLALYFDHCKNGTRK